MDFENILLEIKNHIAIVTINRPQKLNALNIQTIEELKSVFNEINNNTEIRAVVLTGSGEKAFVAGADISELNKLSPIEAKEFSLNGQSVFNSIENLSKPVIAAINGFALGGGCELSLSCHIRFASENAKFGQPEVNLGIIPGYGGTQRLSRLINNGRALEYILSGDMFDAQEAFRLGLVSKIFSQADLLNKTIEFAEKITSKPHHAVRLAIKSVNAVNSMSLTEGLNYEAALFALATGTDDFKEGTSAFLEKRKPEFRHS
ncbi:MAG: enoyl-CoA hydratase-related protein [Ignavibacteria bacterium]|jgi:enoyl-CoA hydratase|nr:enoyl-CoA hydratase-related protein [Ignavibacteria bacterium]